MDRKKFVYLAPFIPFMAADGIDDLRSSVPFFIVWGAAQIVLAAGLSFFGYQGLKEIKRNKQNQVGKP
ncbi:hypothetical protein [Streptomyces sp. 11x1]|uniref:hypothetical protein n=1 Tax=Streptomyces sp. 11x1 TaxID=3038642 RepID=UPI00292F81FA|nr:hypothetical protein [Streptomyces sp. 11x1]WNZ10155.1 hypothetical protein P8T65_22890 [Streptomyces sp. 11x1]